MIQKNDIKSRTITFIAAQTAILGVIMLSFVVLASVLFVKNATRWQLNNIEEAVLVFGQQAAHSQEIPKRGDLGQYSFFILGRDGKYILPRFSRTDDDERIWQEYELKLIYEMQKRRDGWVYYPEKERAGWRRGQNAIRFIYLDKQEWIVAAEGFVPSGWSMLEGFLTPKLFMGLSFVVLTAFALMLFNALWHFRKVMKAILRSQENNFIASSAAKPAAEPPFIKHSDATLSEPIHQDVTKVLPKIRQAYVEPAPASPAAMDDSPLARAESRTAELVASEPEKMSRNSGPRQFDDLGAVSIDMSGIRSPLLRKVIDELREKKA